MKQALGIVLAFSWASWAVESLVRVPAGSFSPLYSVQTQGGSRVVKVESFWLTPRAVTNREYLEFVKRNPQWRRSRAPKVLAEREYLKHWKGDLELAEGQAEQPVVYVSWFAARAFCEAQGQRLPGMMEWEYAARASQTSPNGEADPAFQKRILAWYSKPSKEKLDPVGSGFRNYYGLYGMHGQIWEWVNDFNGVLLDGEGRGNAALDRNQYCAAGVTGGADPRAYASYMRFAFRSSLKGRYCLANLGFRVAGKGMSP